AAQQPQTRRRETHPPAQEAAARRHRSSHLPPGSAGRPDQAHLIHRRVNPPPASPHRGQRVQRMNLLKSSSAAISPSFSWTYAALIMTLVGAMSDASKLSSSNTF